MNQLLNCKWKLEDIKHNARALLCIRPMWQERVKWRNISFFNVKKLNKRRTRNSNYQKWSQIYCSKAGKNKTKPASPPKPCALPWEEATKKRASTKSNISPTNLPHNHKRITTNGCGISPQDQDTDMARAEGSFLDRDLEGIFLLFTLIQWLAGHVAPTHCHGIESHGNRTRPISDFSFPAFSNMTPKGRVPGVVVRSARTRGNVNEGVIHTARLQGFVFSLAHSTDGVRMEEWPGRAEPQTASDRKHEMVSSTSCWELQEMQSIAHNW